jgi:hypothetical protein
MQNLRLKSDDQIGDKKIKERNITYAAANVNDKALEIRAPSLGIAIG